MKWHGKRNANCFSFQRAIRSAIYRETRVQLCSHTYFSRHHNRHGDISPSLEKSVLPVSWLTIRAGETSRAKKPLKNLLLCTSQRELAQTFPRLANNLYFWCFTLHIYTSRIHSVLYGSIDWERVFKISSRLSIKVCIYISINQMHHQLFMCCIISFEKLNIKKKKYQDIRVFCTAWK